MGRHILAIDGGGTKSRVALADADGNVLAQLEGGFANLTSDFEASRRNIEQAIESVYSAAKLPNDSRRNDVAVLGIAGANVGDFAKRLAAAMDFASVHVMSDREITIAGVLGTGDGTLAQMGTGSFFVSQLQGRTKQIGGWGLQLGDDCSGAWLGRELLRWTLKAHDGLVAPTGLTGDVLAKFGHSPSKIVLFAKTATPQDFGQFAPEIFLAHESGDSVAARIVGTAVNDLEAILRTLEAERAGRIYLCGSVGKRYANLLSENFSRLITSPQGDGLSGAIMLGVKMVAQRPETGSP